MPPTNYSEWVSLLKKFENGDDSVLDEMKEGSFELNAGNAPRYYSKVECAYRSRKVNWLENFQNSINTQILKSYSEYEMTLRNAKQNLFPLFRFVYLRSLPDEISKVLKSDIESFSEEIKKSLLNSVSSNIREGEKILIMIRRFSFYSKSIDNLDENTCRNIEQVNTDSPFRRKIIF